MRKQSIAAYRAAPVWRATEGSPVLRRSTPPKAKRKTKRTKKKRKKASSSSSASSTCLLSPIDMLTTSDHIYTSTARVALRPQAIFLAAMDAGALSPAVVAAEETKAPAQRRASLTRWRTATRKAVRAARWARPSRNPKGGSSFRRGTFHGTYTLEEVAAQRSADAALAAAEEMITEEIAEETEDSDEEAL